MNVTYAAGQPFNRIERLTDRDYPRPMLCESKSTGACSRSPIVKVLRDGELKLYLCEEHGHELAQQCDPSFPDLVTGSPEGHRNPKPR